MPGKVEVMLLYTTQHGTEQCTATILIHLVQAAAAQVVCDDHVGHSVEHKLYILRVCGAGHVAVDFLGCRLVLSLELCLDVGSCLPILLGPCIFRETDGEWRS